MAIVMSVHVLHAVFKSQAACCRTRHVWTERSSPIGTSDRTVMLHTAGRATAVHRALGLTDDEATDIEAILGRAPEPPRAGHVRGDVVASTARTSRRASTSGGCRPRRHGCSSGPGENAGVVDVGDGIAAAIRIESHNHPSAIEPYQGAATGVGGILRDIFTMGARPIALMDPLRFGPLDDPRSRWIAEGVVSGISGYGNSVGVPTVGGEVVFDETYAGNPLVNVLCLGRAARPSGWCSAGPPASATWPCCSVRPPAATASAASACWRRPGSATRGDDGQAAERAGGRPVRGEAADRGVPGPARRRAGRRHPGPGRGRAHCATSETASAAAWAWTSTWPPCPGASRAWSRSRS